MARRSRANTSPATQALARAEIHYTERRYDHDPAVTDYGAEAARKLDVDPARIFKTLLVDDGSDLAVAVVPVTRFLDVKAMAVTLGVKRVAMATPDDAEKATGYIVGAISPIGQRRRLRTVIDDSATMCDTVLISGGRRGLDLELAPDDLVILASARTAAIARTS
ncbi:Cys-tRNA(Pro) deacylase [Demetria terragena]|uniref:Cys-tRNA(Pro) deacylase n=1 Tax=Demetria terragena TaxID=63959 RepID=UPI000378CA8E|nr:Cys-tRNA(Pro) deacylase [Demetria terragena]